MKHNTGAEPTTPSVGRMYDYYLNGKEHYQVDQAAAKRIVEKIPEIFDLANLNRMFLQRAAGTMARAGIRQFIDLGAGLPTQMNTDQVVQTIDPDARVVYVDIEEDIREHALQLLELRRVRNVAFICADARDADGILNHPETTNLINFDEPVGILQVALLHFVSDEEDPYGLVRKYMDAVPSGSYLAISHATADGQNPAKVQRFLDVYENATAQLYFRTKAEVDRLFEGLTYLPPYEGAEPGLSHIGLWGERDLSQADPGDLGSWAHCGVAIKP